MTMVCLVSLVATVSICDFVHGDAAAARKILVDLM